MYHLHPDDSLRLINDHLATLRDEARRAEFARRAALPGRRALARERLLHRNFMGPSRLLRRVTRVRTVLAPPCRQDSPCTASTSSP